MEVKKLIQRVEQLEKNWADFGYPVNLDTDTKPIPEMIKIKIEPGLGCSDKEVIEQLTTRIRGLENKWIGFFGELKPKETNISNESPGTSASSSRTQNEPSASGQLLDEVSDDELESDNDEYDDDNQPQELQGPQHDTRRNRKRAKKDLPKKFPCALCPEAFARLRGLKHHVKTIHRQKVYGCGNCKILFTTEAEKVNHDEANHRFSCDFCPGWRIRIQSKREHHVNKVHGLQSTTCYYCGMPHETYAEVVDHLRGHTAEAGRSLIFQCDQCTKPMFFYSEQDRADHMDINFHRGFGARRDFERRNN